MNDTQKLTRSKKSAWSIGSITDVYMTNALNYLAFPIFNMGLGVDPRMLGWALGLPRIWDAISDPLWAIFPIISARALAVVDRSF